jgi:tetratricopeptide (TPR) repeat protein
MAGIGIIVAAVLAAGTASAQPSRADFYRANDLYAREEYQQARDLYQKIADQGWENPALYYNLGNCHFKLGELGRAIANYRRAWKLAPRDSEINFNLAHARRFLRDEIPQQPAGWGERLQLYLAGRLPLSKWSAATAVLYFLTAGAVMVAVVIKPWRRAALSVFKYLVPVFVLSLLATGAVYHYHNQERGVFIAPEIPVRYGPQEQDLVAFTLHAGTEVRLLRRREDWSQVLLAEDKTGWVPSSSLEII